MGETAPFFALILAVPNPAALRSFTLLAYSKLS
jgi:hypothetical protein